MSLAFARRAMGGGVEKPRCSRRAASLNSKGLGVRLIAMLSDSGGSAALPRKGL